MKQHILAAAFDQELISDNQLGEPRQGRPANLKLVPHPSRASGNNPGQ